MMQAAQFLRSRQEFQELRYWLSILSYDTRDRSFVNRAYLLYLILFFSVWFLAVLVFFADGAVSLLSLIGVQGISTLADGLGLVLLSIWALVGLWQAWRGSPLILSETDGLILCQTPLPRAFVVVRWFLMPWLTSFIPFAFVFMLAGFMMAEATGISSIAQMPSYLGYGLNYMLLHLPIHLALMAVLWTIGLIPFRSDRSLRWLRLIIAAALLLTSIALLVHALGGLTPGLISAASQGRISPFLLCIRLVLPVTALGLLYPVSTRVNLTCLAASTAKAELIQSLLRFGFTSSAEDEALKDRLSSQTSVTAPVPPDGWRSLGWLNRIRARRRWRFKSLQPWILVMTYAFTLTMIPLSFASLLVLVVFIQQVAELATGPLLQNMSGWSLMRPLPVTPAQVISSHLTSLMPALLGAELAGFLLAFLIVHQAIAAQSVFLIGLSLVVCVAAIWDCLTGSRSRDLYSEAPARTGYRTVFLGLARSGVYMLLASIQPAMALVIILLMMAGISALAYRHGQAAWQRLIAP